jgi:tetratricopeptide (TPR) repeat protein
MHKGLIPLMLAVVPVILTGCEKKQEATVLIRYELVPKEGLPPGMKALAVLPMEAQGEDEAKWQEMATEMMHSRIVNANQKFNLGLQVADRKNVASLVKEKEAMRAGLVEMKQAQEAAKLINVQGLVMGRCVIKVEVHEGQKRTVSGLGAFASAWSGGGHVETEESKSISRNVTVQVTFRLLDAANGKDWYTYSPEKPLMVSDKKKPGPIFGSSQTEADLSPRDQLVGMCVEEAVIEFLSHMIPCSYEFKIDIESSTNKDCVTGVKLVRGEDFDGAITAFKSALAENAEDDRAAFNMGVVYEKMGRLDEALDAYRKALVIKNEPEYTEARDRVAKFKDRVKKAVKTARIDAEPAGMMDAG